MKMGTAKGKGGGRILLAAVRQHQRILSKPLFYNGLEYVRLRPTGMLHAYLNRDRGCQSA